MNTILVILIVVVIIATVLLRWDTTTNIMEDYDGYE